MRLQIQRRGFDSTEVDRDAIEKPLRLTLGPLAPGLRVARVSVARTESASGAPAVHCRLWVQSDAGTAMCVEEQLPSLQEAISGAAERLRRRLVVQQPGA